MSTNFEILKAEIIARSVSQTWALALPEWDLERIEYTDCAEKCLCSKYPIMELCFLRNKRNGQEAMVGNVCVDRFMGIASSIIFDGFRRISKDPEKALNESLADYARYKNLINEWEYDFSIDTMKRRWLTSKQLATRVRINEKLIQNIKRAGAKTKIPTWKSWNLRNPR